MSIDTSLWGGAPVSSTTPAWGEITPTVAGTQGREQVGGITVRYLSRAAPAADNYAQQLVAAFPFHHLLDPSSGEVPYVLIVEDVVGLGITAGTVTGAFGLTNYLTQTDPNTLLGIGWRTDKTAADNVWRAFIRTSADDINVTTVKETTTAINASGTLERLAIVIDGRDHSVTWRRNGTVVDTYTFAAAVDKMGATPGPQLRWQVDVPAAGTGRIRMHGGGWHDTIRLIRYD